MSEPEQHGRFNKRNQKWLWATVQVFGHARKPKLHTAHASRERERESALVHGLIGLGLKGWSLHPCVPVGARGKEPSSPTELEAPPLTVVMFALWVPGHALCFWVTVVG